MELVYVRCVGECTYDVSKSLDYQVEFISWIRVPVGSGAGGYIGFSHIKHFLLIWRTFKESDSLLQYLAKITVSAQT